MTTEQLLQQLIEINQSNLEYTQELLAIQSWTNNVWIPALLVITIFWVVYSQFFKMRD